MRTIERDRTKRAASGNTTDRCAFRRAAALVLSFVSSVSAAVETPTRIPHPLTMLLRDWVVRTELGLDPEQASAVERSLDNVELPLWQLRDLPPTERTARAGHLIARLRQEIFQTLSARQIERLDEIALRAEGIQGVLSPRYASRLRLSSVQRDKMREGLEAMNAQLAALRRETSAGADATALWTYKAQAEREILAVLSESQRNLLLALMGAPFDFSRVEPIACRAPEIRGVETWIHSEPLTLAQLRGQVVALHFYTFGCINCIRNLPHYNAWHASFPSDRFKIIGIHRPETEGERVGETVRRKAVEAGIAYPVAIDNDSANWDAWANRVWPSVYLIDKRGFVRYWWYGEMNWQDTEGEKWMRSRIEQLLAEPD